MPSPWASEMALVASLPGQVGDLDIFPSALWLGQEDQVASPGGRTINLNFEADS